MSEPLSGDGSGAAPTPKSIRQAWRAYEARAVEGTAASLRIGLAASLTADTLVPFIGTHLLANGIEPAFALGPYNQLFQICDAPAAAFGANCDVILLLWRLEDLMADEIADSLEGDDEAMARAEAKIAALAAAIARLRKGFSGTIILGVPPAPMSLPMGLLSLHDAGGLGAIHRRLVAHFTECVAAIEAVKLADLDAVARFLGLAQSYDARQWYLYRQPFRDAFLLEAGRLIGRIIVASRLAAKKCVVLDCDNTLWGGIVGEDGIDGIEIGEDFPGSAFRDFQKLLLAWRRRGVLIALASKNNAADVWEVFEKHDGMVLRKEHISAAQINWQPKAETIALIARELNIGTDSLVFIDDNPMEIAYMREARPEVTSLLLPEHPEEIVASLQNLALFDRLDISDEDRQRADMMRAERDRETLSAQIVHGDFLQALQLRVRIACAAPEELGRITQLINKTNQFNLTTRRRSLDEMRTLAASPGHAVYAIRVTDKFGEYGLTGAVIVEISADRRLWVIDTLLLSCRVLGRGVETSLIAALAADARAAGAVEFEASFIPTRKNGLAAHFLEEQGFSRIDAQRWRLALADAAPIPAHITRLMPEMATEAR